MCSVSDHRRRDVGRHFGGNTAPDVRVSHRIDASRWQNPQWSPARARKVYDSPLDVFINLKSTVSAATGLLFQRRWATCSKKLASDSDVLSGQWIKIASTAIKNRINR